MNARWTIFLTASTALLLCVATLATAAEPNMGQTQAATIRNSTLMGATVLDLQNHKLGLIKDVVFDAQSGQATFVVLDAAGPASAHAMLVVPYSALRVTINPADKSQSVALDLRQEQLQAAPKIQNNQWQMLQDAKFLEQARNFYQPKTYTAERPIEAATPAPNTCPPAPCFVPQPCVRPCWNYDSGWTQELDEFSME
jgi:hypothetical protein